MSVYNLLLSGKAAAIALLLLCAAPVMAAEQNVHAASPQLAQQMRDPLLEQLQRQTREAEGRASEAERREWDAELNRVADQVKQGQARADQTEQRASDEERKQLILQAKSEPANEAYARFENLLTAFGILMALLVIFFAVQTRESAIAAAKAGIEDIRGNLEEKPKEAEEIRVKLEARLEEAEMLLKNIRSLESRAAKIVKNRSPGEAVKSEGDRKVVSDAAVVALAKPIRDRSADDYLVIITKHSGVKDWDAMLKAAREMQSLFP